MVAGWWCLLALAFQTTRAEILLYLKVIRVPFVGSSLAPSLSLSIHLHLSTAVRVYSSTQRQHTAVAPDTSAAAPHGGRAGCVRCAVCRVLCVLSVLKVFCGMGCRSDPNPSTETRRAMIRSLVVHQRVTNGCSINNQDLQAPALFGIT